MFCRAGICMRNHRIMKLFIPYTFLFFLASVGFCANMTIKEVVAGDLCINNFGDYVKLLGVVCPALGESYGNESKEFTTATLKNRRIQLEYDEKARKMDAEGTFIAYVYLFCDTCVSASFEDTLTKGQTVISYQAPLINICAELLERGLARADTVSQYASKPYFKHLEKTARTKKIGMWR